MWICVGPVLYIYIYTLTLQLQHLESEAPMSLIVSSLAMDQLIAWINLVKRIRTSHFLRAVGNDI
jgi:hypothetical protein